MVRNRVYPIIVLLALTGLWPVQALGDGKSPSQMLAPCISEKTLAVVSVDLKRVDIDSVFDMWADVATPIVGAEQAKELVADFQEPHQIIKENLDKLKAISVREVYVVLGFDNLPSVIVAFPISDGMNVLELVNWIDTSLIMGCNDLVRLQKDGLVLVGDKQSIDRCKGALPVFRPELDRAIAGVGESSIQVSVIPNADSRLVLESTLPIMLDRNVKIPANAITKGFQWGSVGIDLPPRMSLNVKIESADASSAYALKELLVTVGGFVSQIPDLRKLSPKIDGVLGMLEPKVEGGKLLISLDSGQCMNLMTDLLGPGLIDLREIASRMQCGTNLSGLGKAILIYANDHEDEFPPDLDTLIKEAEVPPQMLLCGGKSYIYRGVDLGSTSVEPSLIMVHDRVGHHKGGRNVLFVDSHVEWMTEEEFQKQIIEDNKLRRKDGLPEKPAQ